MNENSISVSKDIQTLTTEIRIITRQTQQLVLTAAMEIGGRLVEAKELVPHGQWGDYLKHEVNFSQSTANNLMLLYKEYGGNQESLFQRANSQAIGNLPYTKALRLLALPEEEREKFVEENRVEDMTTRELEQAIRERDAAKAAQRKAEDRAGELERAQEQAKFLMESMKNRAEAAEAQAKKVTELEGKLASAKSLQKDTEAKLKKARENPELSKDQMAQLRREAEAAAAKKATEAAAQELDVAKTQAAKTQAALVEAQNKCVEMEAKLQAAQKAAQLSDPNAAVFQSVFQSVQEEFNRLIGALLKVKMADPQLAEKLKAATLALLDKLRGEV